MADVKLPGVGPVSKKWVIIVLGASAVTVGYVVIRKRSAASAAASTASAADTTGTSDIDPLTGDVAGSAQDQADLAAMQAGGYEGDNLGDGLGDYGGYLAATPAAATIPGAGGFTTNGEWAQQAETDLGGLGIAQTSLSAALGKYLTGQPLASADQQLVDQAIAEEGYPPVSGPGGYPPAMKTSPTSTTTPPPATTVTVPRLAGDRVEDATSALSSLGLKSAFGTRKPGVPYWVTGSSPAAGTRVAARSTVKLTITTTQPKG